MNLADQMTRQIAGSTVNRDGRARRRCQLARELEESGNYEAARGAMGELWERVGEEPNIDNLDRRTAAEVLLRAGALTGRIGSARQIVDAQEIAKDLISRSGAIFESLGETIRVAETQIEIACCYWRAGAYDESRITLREAQARLTEQDSELKAIALVHGADVERTVNRFHDAFNLLADAAPLVESSGSHSLKGKFHNTRALVLRNIGDAEQRADHVDLALVEYAAASFHFEQAGHRRFLASVENNLGFLFYRLERFDEAHEHLDRARRTFISIKESGNAAQVDETRARVLLAQGKNRDAEIVVRRAATVLEKGGEWGLLAEALTTHGTALARLGDYARSRLILDRAIEVAELAGDVEAAGAAALTIIEELGAFIPAEELRVIYERADSLLSHSEHRANLARLRSCARRAVSSSSERTRSATCFAPNFVHASRETAALLLKAQEIARTQSPVLITGETGTGKEVLARLIHQWSGRGGRFIAINCAALPEQLFESELFGYTKGSFTDAVRDHPGAVRQAEGGSLFLDEIAELGLHGQSKLLRLVEHGEVRALGTVEPQRIDVRIIAATNRNLPMEVAQKRFRADLYYRLQTFILEIPPLRARPDDIPIIAEHLVRRALASTRRQVTFAPEAIEAMRLLPLPGNVRELRSIIERTVLAAPDGSTITGETAETLALRRTQDASLADPWEGFSLTEEVRLFEERLIERALGDAQGRVSLAARLLGFKHHESLTWRLRNRNKRLQAARRPAAPRGRSIIK